MTITAAGYENSVQGLTPKLPICPKCKTEFGYRVRRGFLFKKVLNWLPLKRYYCYKCKSRRYIWG